MFLLPLGNCCAVLMIKLVAGIMVTVLVLVSVRTRGSVYLSKNLAKLFDDGTFFVPVDCTVSTVPDN